MRLGNYFILWAPPNLTHSSKDTHTQSTGYVVMHGIQRLIGIFGVLFYFGLNCHAHAPQNLGGDHSAPPQPPGLWWCTTVKGVTEPPRWWHSLRESGLEIVSWALIDWLIDWLEAKVVWSWATFSWDVSGWKFVCAGVAGKLVYSSLTTNKLWQPFECKNKG